jgi:hypothetical protein
MLELTVVETLCSATKRHGGRSVKRGKHLGPEWHDPVILRVAEILIRLVSETLRWFRLAVRSNLWVAN